MFAAALQLHQAGRLADAERFYQEVLKIDPGHPDALHMLGVVAHLTGRNERAVEWVTRAVALKPSDAEARVNLGNALKALGRLDDAIANYRAGLTLRPDFPEAHHNLGVALQDLGRFDEAADSYRQAIARNPNIAESHNNLGAVLNGLGRGDESVASYRAAIRLRPGYAEAHNNLGGVLRALGRLEEATECFRAAIALKPEFSEAHGNLGGALKDLGRIEEAKASYRRATETDPRAFHHAIHGQLLLPPILESAEAVDACRARYLEGLATLAKTPGTIDDPGRRLGQLSFYLAYHDRDDRDAMTKLHDFFRARAPATTYAAPHVAGWRAPSDSGRKIRVGFLSEYLTEHTIGKLYRGFVRHLDRDRFDVVVIHAPNSKPGEMRKRIDADAGRSVNLSHAPLGDHQRAVAEEKLDVLFYPDIGMTPATYFLAYARLAPVQAVGWGHPDTTGLESIDYFLSSAAIEPDGADDHYRERLIRLDRLPCHYELPAAPDQTISRGTLGLPETGVVFGCPQSLFKFHPDFDRVLAAIADGDPAARIVLLAGSTPAWTDQLRARWARTFPVLSERVVFLPRLSLDRFLALLDRVDVLLDPLHFGAGNSFYEAAALGAPTVTWPGRFMRGRIVAGAYRQMNLADAPVAVGPEAYASVALEWGRNPDRCRAFRRAIRQAATTELFADDRAVRAFETFLEAAVASAARGEKLPAGWRPAA